MNTKVILCLCGENYEDKELKNHIKECQIFLNKFRLFDYKIAHLLEEYLSDKKNAFLVRFMFKRYIKIINNIIKNFKREKNNKFLKTLSTNKVSNTLSKKDIYNNYNNGSLNNKLLSENDNNGMLTPNNQKDLRKEIITIDLNNNNINNKGLYCKICSEKLSSSKIVHLNCGHDFHYLCLINRLSEGEKLFGKKLNFNFIKCSICDSMLECPSTPYIQDKIDKNKQLYSQISTMIEQRNIYQKNYLSNSSSFLFHICYKCHQPYYAGKNNNICNEENKQDCLCGKDSFVYDAKGSTFCKKHGFDFIEYKCKFCCNIASRFCSQTHFCEECYASKNYENNCEIKKCEKNKCEFSGMHAPNGEEYCLGCFICRYENVKNEYPTFNDD